MPHTELSPSDLMSEEAPETINENFRTARNVGIATKNATFEAFADDSPGNPIDLYLCTVGSAYDIDLPPAADHPNRSVTFKKVDAAAAAYTINPDGAELIDGAATLVGSTSQNTSRTIVSDGSAWWVIGVYP